MFLKLISCFLLIKLISTANLVRRFTDDIQDVSIEGKSGNIWVVLVAGSNGYYNYRHQSDVLHAYHLIHDLNNIPTERIILMMYDDIAWANENPLKGNIINYPDGENLYTDEVVKDYTGEEVSPENFLGVLLKDEKLIEKNKKVLNSTSEDSVFIYFSDHGAPSMVAFPNGILSATNFKKTLDIMQEQNSFAKLVIYIEACESGSMFLDDLSPKNDSNIYAITASSFNEPSYAIYWDELRKTYLADEFSINWMLDSYSFDDQNKEETLFTQYSHVKDKTVDSHVCEFGDIQMAYQYDTSDFQGKITKAANRTNVEEIIKKLSGRRDVIRSDEVEFVLTKIHSELKKDDSFIRLVKGRSLMDSFMNNLKIKFANRIGTNEDLSTGKNRIENRDCYDELINHLNQDCIPLHVHTYLFRHLYLFVNTCNAIKKLNFEIKTTDLTEIISQDCLPLKNSFITMSKVI